MTNKRKEESNADLELELAVMDDELYADMKDVANKAVTIMNKMAANNKQTTLDYLYRYQDGELLQFIIREGIKQTFCDQLVEVFSAFKLKNERL